MLDREIVREDKITIMSGAGISAESGVPTFRGKDGLWKGYDATKLATPEAFNADPNMVLDWYKWRRELVGECQPNPAHISIAAIEEAGYDVMIVTQNIDNLHRKAGSKRIIELHGNIFRVRCASGCPGIIDLPTDEIENDPQTECAECGAPLRPHVVWFGEMLDANDIYEAQKRLAETTLLFIVGTSGVVQPAASFGYIAKDAGAYVVEVNMEYTPLSAMADVTLIGPAGEVLSTIFKPLINENASA